MKFNVDGGSVFHQLRRLFLYATLLVSVGLLGNIPTYGMEMSDISKIAPGDFQPCGSTKADSVRCRSLNEIGLRLDSVNAVTTVISVIATVPDAPTIYAATAGNGSASISFAAPANNGGSAIIGYTAICQSTSQKNTPNGGGTSSPITVLGLTNGVTYSCFVTASNSVGGSASSSVLSVTPTATANVPGTPNIVSAIAGNAQVTVIFTAPASDGGSAITGYTVFSNPAGGTDSHAGNTSLSHIVTGLNNGTAYTFTVKASNAMGTGPASAASNSVIPASPVSVPSCTMTASPAAIIVGNVAILTVTCTPVATSYSWTNTGFASTVASGAVSPTVTTMYSVIGSNASGAGNSTSVTVAVSSAVATVPSAPIIGSATAGNGQATVTFIAPSSNGGNSITGYTVTSNPAGGSDSNAGSVSLSHVLTGLTNGIAYTFSVKASNAVGAGPASGASNSITPMASGLTDGLVAYYPFDNDALDASGNNNNGLINGGVNFVAGAVGKGAKFNGINSAGGGQNPDYIRVPNSSSLQFSNAMTVSYWIRIDGNRVQTSANCSGAPESGIGGTVLGKSGDRNGFIFNEYDEDSGFAVNPWEGGVGVASPTGSLKSAFGAFRHVTYTVRGNIASLYVNGVLVKSTTGLVDFTPSNSRDMYIGADYNRGGACLDFWGQLDGVIDELRIYNRALSVSEIQQLFNRSPLEATNRPVVEFYNTILDNYFITSDPNEAAAIDGGSAGPGWVRTGETFKSGGDSSVCRFYGSYSPGPNSHFYTVIPSECQSLKNLQINVGDPRKLTVKSWNFESLDFISTIPTSGACPAGTLAVYRAYNNGFARGVDSNHRITSNQAAIAQVVARGWANEGVVMCAPI